MLDWADCCTFAEATPQRYSRPIKKAAEAAFFARLNVQPLSLA